MAALFGVSLQNTVSNDSRFTFRIVGAVTAADVGKAVALDNTADNSVRLAANNDAVYGRLLTVELRTATEVVGTVELYGGFTLPVAVGSTFTRGQTPVGAGNGLVKPAATNDQRFAAVDISKQAVQGFVVFMRT